jgi:hypothetical protein
VVKGKVSHPGPGSGEGSKQGGLAGVGGTHEADISEDAEFQAQAPFLSRLSGLGKAGGAQPGRGEMGVAFAAPTPVGRPPDALRRP